MLYKHAPLSLLMSWTLTLSPLLTDQCIYDRHRWQYGEKAKTDLYQYHQTNIITYGPYKPCTIRTGHAPTKNGGLSVNVHVSINLPSCIWLCDGQHAGTEDNLRPSELTGLDCTDCSDSRWHLARTSQWVTLTFTDWNRLSFSIIRQPDISRMP